jgi:hypothetical protein
VPCNSILKQNGLSSSQLQYVPCGKILYVWDSVLQYAVSSLNKCAI